MSSPSDRINSALVAVPAPIEFSREVLKKVKTIEQNEVCRIYIETGLPDRP